MAKGVSGRGKRLTWDDVEEIRKLTAEGVSRKELAKRFSVDTSTIGLIVRHESWKGGKPSPLRGREGRTPPNKTLAPADTWADKRRRAKEYNKKGGDLSVDKYNEMYVAFQEVQSIDHVAKVTGVAYETARKYIDKGDPARNLRPLRERFEGVVEKAQERQDYTLSVARGEIQRIARALMAKTAAAIQSLDPADIKPFLLGRNLRDVQAVIERTLGAADQTVALRTPGAFDNWTEAELLDFLTKGVTPDRERDKRG